jgi:exosome complex component RRP4
VAQKRWRVDAQSRLDAVLTLASVNLPGGVLRRKSAEDELAMRQFLTEGGLQKRGKNIERRKEEKKKGRWWENDWFSLFPPDVISAEVQQIYADGALGLHTRNLKFGKPAAVFLSFSLSFHSSFFSFVLSFPLFF